MWSAKATSTYLRVMAKETLHPPGISIVLTSSDDTTHLRRCLERFSACWAEVDAEVTVVHAGSRSELASLAQQFSSTTATAWIATDPGTLERDLRRIGLERSRGDIVLFVNDRESERHEWAAKLCRNWGTWRDGGGRVINAPTCDEDVSSRFPHLSVVMPVHDGGPRFLLALQALALSELPRQSWELVIVDDASTDETAVVAAQYADKLLRLRQAPRGPGYARNRGFELTLGDSVAFVNADVMVETNTLRWALELLSENADVGAVFGSCDSSPMNRGVLSEYRSLVQRFYHRRDAEDAVTFSSACGIVRSSVFENAGGYDEWHFSRRQLEDLELGQRIRGLGKRIVVHPGIRAAHLRRWTFRRMIATEIFDRAVPWMRLMKGQLTHDRGGVGVRRPRVAKNINILVTWLGIIAGMLAWSRHSIPLGLVTVTCLAVLLVNSTKQLAFISRERGLGFAAMSVPLDLLYYLVAGVGLLFGWIARHVLGEPTPGAVAEAFAEMGVRRWPPVPVKRLARHAAATPARLDQERSAALANPSVFPQQPSALSPRGDSSQQVQ